MADQTAQLAEPVHQRYRQGVDRHERLKKIVGERKRPQRKCSCWLNTRSLIRSQLYLYNCTGLVRRAVQRDARKDRGTE
jgi:hypothetical protein